MVQTHKSNIAALLTHQSMCLPSVWNLHPPASHTHTHLPLPHSALSSDKVLLILHEEECSVSKAVTPPCCVFTLCPVLSSCFKVPLFVYRAASPIHFELCLFFLTFGYQLLLRITQ